MTWLLLLLLAPPAPACMSSVAGVIGHLLCGKAPTTVSMQAAEIFGITERIRCCGRLQGQFKPCECWEASRPCGPLPQDCVRGTVQALSCDWCRLVGPGRLGCPPSPQYNASEHKNLPQNTLLSPFNH